MEVIRIMKYKVITAMVLAAAMTMAGCAGQGAAPKQEAAQAEAVQETEQNSEAPAEETAENSGTPAEEPAKDGAAGENGGVAADGKYESADGWYVTYNDSLIDVEESEQDGVSFFYTGKSDGVNEITFNYFMNRMPDEVLYDAIANDDGMPEHTRSESPFAGRDDVWSMRVSVAPEDDTLNPQEFIAVEHNGGTLLIQIDSAKEADDANGMKISDTLSAILDSFTFTDHEEQTYSAYVPGKYVMTQTDEIGGENVSAEYYVELNKDHTGVISMQDSIPVIWYSREGIILNADTGEQIYEYDVEGDSLYLIDQDADATFSFERQ